MFFLAFLAATTKDNDYDREWHRCRRPTSLVPWKLLRLIRIDREYLFCVIRKARQRTVKRTGSKMKWVELCGFHFSYAFIFCQPMKKFVFFGASRALSSLALGGRMMRDPGNEVACKLHMNVLSRSTKNTSLLAEALFLLFADGRKETSAMGRKWLFLR